MIHELNENEVNQVNFKIPREDIVLKSKSIINN
jgi:hypothetical protein